MVLSCVLCQRERVMCYPYLPVDPSDPPRPGRKTFQERFDETNARSTAQIEAERAERVASGKPHGIQDYILAQRRGQ